MNEPYPDDVSGPAAPHETGSVPGAEGMGMTGEEETAVCLRCFAPVEEGARGCPNCGTVASNVTTLGPWAGSGVVVGVAPTNAGRRVSRRRHAIWTYAVVWILGLATIPPLIGLAQPRVRGYWGTPFADRDVRLPVVLGWTAVFGALVWRESRRRPATTPDDRERGRDS